MAKRFNETRAKLSKEWQDEVVSFTKWMVNNKNNPNLSLQQVEQKKSSRLINYIIHSKICHYSLKMRTCNLQVLLYFFAQTLYKIFY